MLFDDKELEAIAQKKKKQQQPDMSQQSAIHADICSLIKDFPRAAKKVDLLPIEHGWMIHGGVTDRGFEEYFITPDGDGHRIYTVMRQEIDRPMTTSELATRLMLICANNEKMQHTGGGDMVMEDLRTRIKNMLLAVLKEDQNKRACRPGS